MFGLRLTKVRKIEIDLTEYDNARLQFLSARTGLSVDTLVEHAILDYIIRRTVMTDTYGKFDMWAARVRHACADVDGQMQVTLPGHSLYRQAAEGVIADRNRWRELSAHNASAADGWITVYNELRAERDALKAEVEQERTWKEQFAKDALDYKAEVEELTAAVEDADAERMNVAVAIAIESVKDRLVAAEKLYEAAKNVIAGVTLLSTLDSAVAAWEATKEER